MFFLKIWTQNEHSRTPAGKNLRLAMVGSEFHTIGHIQHSSKSSDQIVGWSAAK